MEVFSPMVSVIVQVVIVEQSAQSGLVNIFVFIIIKWSISLAYFSVKMVIYVTELHVKTREFVLFEIQTDRMRVFVFVDLVPGEIIVN
jgi:ABC-type transport system involved in cytochrome c biogenesis permease subunit